MADEEPQGFWNRLKGKLKGDKKPEAPQEPASPAEPVDEPPAVPGPEEVPAEAQAVEDEVLPEADEPTTPPPSDEPEQEPKKEPTVLSTSELKTDTVGRVYAQALLEMATERGVVDEVALEVQDLLPLIAEDGDLYRLLVNPAIGDQERGQIIQRIFEGKVSDLLYKMLRVLGDKGRLGSLPEVASGYLLAVAEARGQVDVEAHVASPLDEATAKRVADQIGEALGGKGVTLTQKVEPSLIGGMKIKVGDRLIDASVASQLRNMKNKMIAAARG